MQGESEFTTKESKSATHFWSMFKYMQNFRKWDAIKTTFSANAFGLETFLGKP